MKAKTNVKAGGFQFGNHNETVVRETVVRDVAKAKGLTVKTNVKAGGFSFGNTAS